MKEKAPQHTPTRSSRERSSPQSDGHDVSHLLALITSVFIHLYCYIRSARQTHRPNLALWRGKRSSFLAFTTMPVTSKLSLLKDIHLIVRICIYFYWAY